MGAPNNLVIGIAIVLVSVAFGISLMNTEEPPAPKVAKAPSRATIERELREGEVLKGPARTPFALRHPDSWAALPEDEIPEGEPEPVAGLRRDDSTGLLTVSVRAPLAGGIAAREKTLRAELEQRLDDARVTAVRRVRVAAGPALYASFIREKSGQVQSMLLVPEGSRRTYQVDAAVRPQAQDAAAELRALLRTFDIAGP